MRLDWSEIYRRLYGMSSSQGSFSGTLRHRNRKKVTRHIQGFIKCVTTMTIRLNKNTVIKFTEVKAVSHGLYRRPAKLKNRRRRPVNRMRNFVGTINSGRGNWITLILRNRRILIGPTPHRFI